MDDGDIAISDNVLLPNTESSSNFQASTSVNTISEFLKNTRTCTHTHTCNPPGPDAAHTHTCYHTHTQVFASPEENQPDDKEHTSSKPKKPAGNREAVRKYREKKKAHTAYLEEEVKKLRLLNQQLVRKLQGQALLEAEASRLRSILVDLKGKIDNELGVYPFHKQCNSSDIFKEGDTDMLSNGQATDLQCQNNSPCFFPHAGSSSKVAVCGNGTLMVPEEENCQSAALDCQLHTNNMTSNAGLTTDTVDNLVPSSSQAE
ncbi:hypothetical protein L6164_023073 [Bauhinia variegata]|uniref:Uncharacterized protein n=1 Tax=Bauhinia variegata TaxID=167791 RepID=A0ACB9MH50_BAUVA|nr:hypothetical protein L6164_023073 [Bauhinia variegata]